jgi:predicted DNA-binding ribbon-helix-helix protein
LSGRNQMSDDRIRDYAKSKGFHPQTLTRWLDWSPHDRRALFTLAERLKIGDNHLRDFMDWLEEIALRDQCSVHEILAEKTITDIGSDPRLGRADKLKRIKEQIRRLRFPRLTQIEDSIRARIQQLKLPSALRLSVPPGLEGGNLRVEFNASTAEELKKFGAQLAEVADRDSVREIFRVLTGRHAEKDPQSIIE